MGHPHLKVKIPCGQCIGCRLERSRQWAIRCVHEAQMHEENSFLTLTYNNDNLPPYGTLVKRDVQLFMKRLRKWIWAKYRKKIRYYYCGEYGPKFSRPHYHIILFGFQFKDRELWRIENGNKVYISKELAKIWGNGYTTIGDVTFESAAYVSRYITKKITGKAATDHYTVIDPDTGEIIGMQPEFTDMSRRSGIGKTWFKKYTKDVYPDDFVIINGKKMKPPKYYTRQYEIEYPEDAEILKTRRKQEAFRRRENATEERLKTREKIQMLKMTQLKRRYENEI